MKLIKLSCLFLLMLTLTFSCSKEPNEDVTKTEVSFELPEDVLNAILSKGHNPENFEYKEMQGINGELMQLVIFDDIAYDRQNFIDLYSTDGVTDRQYSTEFKVDTDIFTEINIYAFTGSSPAGFGLSPAALQATIEAVDNWNSVNFNSIKLVLTASDNPNFDLDVFETVVFVQPALGDVNFSGFAEFPLSDGSPGNFAVISSVANEFAEFNTAGIRRLITHELGHTIGFRHTDWDTRRSCVIAGIEAEESREEDANLINGTPPTFFYQSNSIMNACFDVNSTNGRLTIFDKIALRLLYPYSQSFNGFN